MTKAADDVRKDIDRALDNALKGKYAGKRQSTNVEDRRGEGMPQSERYRQFGTATGLVGGVLLGSRLAKRFSRVGAKQAAMASGVLVGGAAGMTVGDAMARRIKTLSKRRKK